MMVITRGLGVSVRKRGVHVCSATGDAISRGDGSHGAETRVTAVKRNHIAQQLVHNWVIRVQ